MKNLLYTLIFLLIVGIFFRPVIFGKLPIPSDTIIGLYHPYRDLYDKEYPRGIPFKNSLITDPVRQQYPWKILTINLLKKFKISLWNPYSFSGTPLLGNYQSSPFYPLNIFYFLLPFSYAWTLLIILQPILAGIFLYFYIDYFKLNKMASLLAGITWAFCGFSIAWLEWNTIVHTALWLPLILLAKENLLKKFSAKWIFIFLFSEVSSIFAGHLQTYFYLLIFSNLYLFVRLVQFSVKMNKLGTTFKNIILRYIPFMILGGVVLLITFIQWYPTLQFILLSGRSIDQSNWQKEGWFIPWQHIIQFVFPDFFGNPTTLNYWGVWNYGEFVGYVGIIPLLMALYALFFRKDKKTFFFGVLFFLSLIFSFPTYFAKIPYLLNLPFISSAQPTRMLFITDFTLSILAALGLDYFLRTKNRSMVFPILFIGFVLISIWIFVLLGKDITSYQNLAVAKNNLIFPTLIFFFTTIVIFLIHKTTKTKMIQIILLYVLTFITVFDLLRFSEKFTPFTKKEYLFPDTKTIEFLRKNIGNHRMMSLDLRIFPPNFSVIYKLQSIEGYDPLYLQRYGEFIAASERGKPDISSPFGFNRIITPHNYESRIIDLLGVKYILSLNDLSSPKLKKVFQEGETRVYENLKAFPRAFFVELGSRVVDKNRAIELMFNNQLDLSKHAIVEDAQTFNFKKMLTGTVSIIEYSENKATLTTENKGDGFLVLSDSYYPAWRALIDGRQSKIHITDYNFRGIFVPKGKHKIEFYISLL